MTPIDTIERLDRAPGPGDKQVQVSRLRDELPDMLRFAILKAFHEYPDHGFLGYRYETVLDGDLHEHYNLYAYFCPPIPHQHLNPSNMANAHVPNMFEAHLDVVEMGRLHELARQKGF